MATNRDFTLKRHNGTDYDVLLATTHVGQIYTDSTLTTTLQSVLDAKVPLSQKGAANGVAPLNSSSKIDNTYLPDSVFSGMRYIGTAGLNGSTTEYLNDLFTEVTLSTKDELTGAYKIVVSAGKLGGQTPPGAAGTIVHVLGGQDDSGGEGTVITLEVGDWIVLREVVSITNYYVAYYDIVNNTYKDADVATKGVVKLSDATVYSTLTGTDVITETVLKATIDNANFQPAGSYQPLDTDLTTIAGLSNADSNFIVGNGTSWTVESGATARASLGLTIGSQVQAYDATLAGIAAIAPLAAGNMIYTTGTDTFGSTAVTEYGRGMLNWSNATVAQTGLNLVPGTHVQAYDQHLAAIAGLAKTDGNIIVGNGTTWVAESGATARASLGLAIGTNVQAYDADLDTLSTLAKTDGNFIVGNGTTWVAESGATARTSLGVYSTTEVDSLLTNRPEIFYDTTTGAGSGDLIIDLD